VGLTVFDLRRIGFHADWNCAMSATVALRLAALDSDDGGCCGSGGDEATVTHVPAANPWFGRRGGSEALAQAGHAGPGGEPRVSRVVRTAAPTPGGPPPERRSRRSCRPLAGMSAEANSGIVRYRRTRGLGALAPLADLGAAHPMPNP
jgi:hypothetical protein